MVGSHGLDLGRCGHGLRFGEVEITRVEDYHGPGFKSTFMFPAFRPEMCEADPETFARARVFVDTHEGAMEEAGDLLHAIAAGAIRADAIEADLAALCSGAHPGRGGDDKAITLFKSVGTAIEDLAAAELVVGDVAP